MASTPNFNWATPDNTGLVKNGALDIRTLGNAIDASMADLKGGTTGQVLAKQTNTDMDFTWTTPTSGMTNPMTTTGDTIYSSSGSTPARLGIGSTGQVLTVSGGVPVWATPAGGGGMTSIASGNLTGSSVSITSISGSYKNLQLVIRQFRGTDDGAELTSTVNSDTASVYGKSASVSELNVSATSSAWTQFSRRQDNTANRSLIVYDYMDYANGSTWKIVDAFAVTVDSVDPSQFNIQKSAFIYRQPSAISSIQLYPDTGTFTGGTYILYGVN